MAENGQKGLHLKVQTVTVQGKVHYLLLDDNLIPIPEVVNYVRYLEIIQRQPNTIKSYLSHLKLYYEFMTFANFNVLDIAKFKQPKPVQILLSFMQWLQTPGPIDNWEIITLDTRPVRTPQTINLILNTVLRFYDFLFREGKVETLDVYQNQIRTRKFNTYLSQMFKAKTYKSSILKLKEDKHPPKYITRNEYETLFHTCQHLRDKAILALMFEGGLRLSEVLGLHISDLKALEDNEIQIKYRSDNINHTFVKNQAEGMIPIPPYVAQLLVEYLMCKQINYDSDYVFLNLYHQPFGTPMTPLAVQKLFERLSKKTGIKVHPHMLRHGFAVDKLNAGWSMELVQSYLRHVNPTTTELYAEYTPSKKKEMMEKFVEDNSSYNDYQLLTGMGGYQ